MKRKRWVKWMAVGSWAACDLVRTSLRQSLGKSEPETGWGMRKGIHTEGPPGTRLLKDICRWVVSTLVYIGARVLGECTPKSSPLFYQRCRCLDPKISQHVLLCRLRDGSDSQAARGTGWCKQESTSLWAGSVVEPKDPRRQVKVLGCRKKQHRGLANG